MMKSWTHSSIGFSAISGNISRSTSSRTTSSRSAMIVSCSFTSFARINTRKAMLSIQSNRPANLRMVETIKRKICLQQKKLQKFQLQSQRRWLSSKDATASTIEEGIVNIKKHTTIQSWIYEQWDKGTVLFGISFFILLYNIDLILQYNQQLKDRERYGTDFSSSKETYESMNKEIGIIRQELYNNYKNIPYLYQAIVHIQYKLNGSHGLSNVQLNDIIDIIEENVGPENAYHLCRSYKLDVDGKTKIVSSIGWYPIAYITPINTNEQQVTIVNGQIQIVPKKRSLLQRLFGRSTTTATTTTATTTPVATETTTPLATETTTVTSSTK